MTDLASARSGELADRRRTEIIAVAQRIFGELGTTEVSMDELATAAGVARSTLYVYFPSRADLLVACISSMYDAMLGSIDLVEASEPRAALAGIVAALFSAIDGHPAFFRLALAAQASPGDAGLAIAARLGSIGDEVGGAIAKIIEEGNRSGTWEVADARRASEHVGQQIYGALSVRASLPIPSPSDEAAAELVDFVVDGLAGPRRRGRPGA